MRPAIRLFLIALLGAMIMASFTDFNWATVSIWMVIIGILIAGYLAMERLGDRLSARILDRMKRRHGGRIPVAIEAPGKRWRAGLLRLEDEHAIVERGIRGGTIFEFRVGGLTIGPPRRARLRETIFINPRARIHRVTGSDNFAIGVLPEDSTRLLAALDQPATDAPPASS